MTINSKKLKSKKSLLSDSRGAIFVMGVFMAALAAGMLYYMVGMAESIFLQERMQDAADSAAFGAAVVRARGMNILVLINLIMASIIAILILLRMMITILTAGAGLALALSLIPFAAAGMGPASVKLFAAAKKIDKLADGYEDASEPILKGADKTSNLIRKAVPTISNLKLTSIPLEHFGPVAQTGVPTEIANYLPTYDGSYRKLCLKASKLAGEAVAIPIEWVPLLPGTIKDFMSGLVKDMVEGYGKYYCGVNANPPFVKREMENPVPTHTHPDYIACDNGDSAACTSFNDFSSRLKDVYDGPSGSCQSSDNSLLSYCQSRTSQSRTECKPAFYFGVGYSGKHDDLESWQIRTLKKEMTFEDINKTGNWVLINEKVIQDGKVEEITENPCNGNNMTAWDRGENGSVCSTNVERLQNAATRADKRELVVEYKEVTDVLQCVAKSEKEITLSIGRPDSDPEIHYEEICDCLELGSEKLQVRALVKGEKANLLRKTRKNIEVANVGKTTRGPSSLVENIESLGGFSFAQAEIFVDDRDGSGGSHESEKDEWMWHMHWRARLRRTRGVAEEDACNEVNESEQKDCEIETNVATVIADKMEAVNVSTH